MEIAIIGAGNVGKALAGSAVRAGHGVTVSASRPGSAKETAEATGAQAAGSNREAAKGAEVVILAVPHGIVEEMTRELGDALDGKVVVDVTNQMNDAMTTVAEEGRSVAERIKSVAPNARVTKAFNYSFAHRMAGPIGDGTPIDGFVAGDDSEAKAKVLELAESIGYRPIDAGPLVTARSLEHLGALIVGINARNKGSWQNGWKLIGPD